MCTIDRMLIKGIRSFSPDNKDVIVFFKPLTLIVGANGAGKTTVIECLKQACTGELPPNTRSGQSFVHDPKVAHETEVKAQIKLRFKTQSGQQITVVRSFQLTQKKTTLQFKTLDSVLSTEDMVTKEKKAVTYRCVDIDRMVPALMGVSKAVLENVIFVHQEDSNWPLAEGKVLKDRFDDIFAATKYTKALESLRKLRTEKAQEVKEMKLELDHLRTHRDTSRRLESEVAEAVAAVKAKLVEAEVHDKQAQECGEKVTQLAQALERLTKLGGEIRVGSARLQELEKQAELKRAQLQDLHERQSTAEVREMLSNFERDIDQTRATSNELTRQIHRQRVEQNSLVDKQTREVKRHSLLLAERNAYDAAVSDRDRFVREVSAREGVPLAGTQGGSTPISAAALDAFQNELKAHVAGVEGELHALKESHARADEGLSAAVDQLTTRITQQQEELRMKRSQGAANAQAIEDFQAQAEAIHANEMVVAEGQRRVDAAQDALRAAQEEQVSGRFDEKLVQEKRQMDECTSSITELRQERDRVAAAGEQATRARMKAAELADKEAAQTALLRRTRPKLLHLLRNPAELPPLVQLKGECEAEISNRRTSLNREQEGVNTLRAEQAAAQAQLTSMREAVNRSQAHLNQALQQLQQAGRSQPSPLIAAVREEGVSAVDVTALDARLVAAEAKLAKQQASHSRKAWIATYMSKIKDLMKSERMCPACRRAFITDDEVNQSIALIEDELREGRDDGHAKAELASQEEAFKALKAAQPVWHRVVQLEGELRDLQSKKESHAAALATATATVNDATDELATAQVELADSTQLVGETVWQLDRSAKEIAALKDEVRIAEASAAASQGVAVGRSLNDLDDMIEQTELSRQTRESTRDILLRKQGRVREKVLSSTTELGEARESLNLARARIDKKRQLLQKVAELETANVELTAACQRLEAAGTPLIREREVAQGCRSAHKAAAQREQDVAEEKLRNARQLMDTLDAKMRPVLDYQRNDKASALAEAERAAEGVKADIGKANMALTRMEEELREASTKLADQEGIRRTMQDVLELRGVQEQHDAQLAAIRDLEEQMAKVGNQDVLQRQARAAADARRQAQQQLDMIKGAVQMQEAAAQRGRSTLAAKEYQGIGQRYNRKFAEVLYSEMANGDLEKYHKALEKALLAFHTTKMADINKIIKEMWQKTYRGQDIDYIQIKADADGARSYNYRVVMYNGGAELDMRGRCSAGQKVLACLIIRLALAETFCLNCGILALDEPTTNLDADNAISLAEALRAIMMSRRDQANFQLIIITHDERFAHQIGTREQAEFLWRITKDENQHSKISQEDIDDQ